MYPALHHGQIPVAMKGPVFHSPPQNPRYTQKQPLFITGRYSSPQNLRQVHAPLSGYINNSVSVNPTANTPNNSGNLIANNQMAKNHQKDVSSPLIFVDSQNYNKGIPNRTRSQGNSPESYKQFDKVRSSNNNSPKVILTDSYIDDVLKGTFVRKQKPPVAHVSHSSQTQYPAAQIYQKPIIYENESRQVSHSSTVKKVEFKSQESQRSVPKQLHTYTSPATLPIITNQDRMKKEEEIRNLNLRVRELEESLAQKNLSLSTVSDENAELRRKMQSIQAMKITQYAPKNMSDRVRELENELQRQNTMFNQSQVEASKVPELQRELESLKRLYSENLNLIKNLKTELNNKANNQSQNSLDSERYNQLILRESKIRNLEAQLDRLKNIEAEYMRLKNIEPEYVMLRNSQQANKDSLYRIEFLQNENIRLRQYESHVNRLIPLENEYHRLRASEQELRSRLYNLEEENQYLRDSSKQPDKTVIMTPTRGMGGISNNNNIDHLSLVEPHVRFNLKPAIKSPNSNKGSVYKGLLNNRSNGRSNSPGSDFQESISTVEKNLKKEIRY